MAAEPPLEPQAETEAVEQDQGNQRQRRSSIDYDGSVCVGEWVWSTIKKNNNNDDENNNKNKSP